MVLVADVHRNMMPEDTDIPGRDSFASPVTIPCTTVELAGVGLDRGLLLVPDRTPRTDLKTDSTAG